MGRHPKTCSGSWSESQTEKFLEDFQHNRDTIPESPPESPEEGSLYYDTTERELKVFTGLLWIPVEEQARMGKPEITWKITESDNTQVNSTWTIIDPNTTDTTTTTITLEDWDDEDLRDFDEESASMDELDELDFESYPKEIDIPPSDPLLLIDPEVDFNKKGSFSVDCGDCHVSAEGKMVIEAKEVEIWGMRLDRDSVNQMAKRVLPFMFVSSLAFWGLLASFLALVGLRVLDLRASLDQNIINVMNLLGL